MGDTTTTTTTNTTTTNTTTTTTTTTLTTSTTMTTIDCGLEHSCNSNRGVMDGIFGGTPTQVNQYPWMVKLRYRQGNTIWNCGGTLIASRYVLTAAHCMVVGGDETKLKVTIGDHDLQATTETCLSTITLGVKRIKIHEDYILIEDFFGSIELIENDIAILELEEEVDLGIYTPACLPEQGEDYSDETENIFTYGWGLGSGYILHQIEFEDLSLTDNGQFLENGNGEGKSAGGGDSGGPLTYKDTDQSHTLIGVTSYGTPGRLSGFARVAYYRDWINNNTKNAEYC